MRRKLDFRLACAHIVSCRAGRGYARGRYPNALAPGEMLLGSTRPSGPTQKKERLHVRARHLRPGPRGQGRDRERLEDLVPERAPDHERAGRLQGRPIAGGSETGKGLSVTLWEGDEGSSRAPRPSTTSRPSSASGSSSPRASTTRRTTRSTSTWATSTSPRRAAPASRSSGRRRPRLPDHGRLVGPHGTSSPVARRGPGALQELQIARPDRQGRGGERGRASLGDVVFEGPNHRARGGDRGGLPDAAAHLGRQPEIQSSRKLDPHLAEPRDMSDPDGARNFFIKSIMQTLVVKQLDE